MTNLIKSNASVRNVRFESNCYSTPPPPRMITFDARDEKNPTDISVDYDDDCKTLHIKCIVEITEKRSMAMFADNLRFYQGVCKRSYEDWFEPEPWGDEDNACMPRMIFSKAHMKLKYNIFVALAWALMATKDKQIKKGLHIEFPCDMRNWVPIDD